MIPMEKRDKTAIEYLTAETHKQYGRLIPEEALVRARQCALDHKEPAGVLLAGAPVTIMNSDDYVYVGYEDQGMAGGWFVVCFAKNIITLTTQHDG